MERWAGRVALVTGASGNIGTALCARLVEEGMKVVGASRDVEKIQALAEFLADKPGSLTAIKCDLTKDEDIFSLFSTIKDKFGGVDVCVNNAGKSFNHGLLDGTPDEWRFMLGVSVVGLCLCTREAVASMRERDVPEGQIIHISSMSAHRVSTYRPVHFHAAAKFAVRALTEGLRQELREAESRIRVASISPGAVGSQGEATYPCLQPEDIASSVVHILSAPPHVQIHDILVRPTEQKF